MSVRVMTWVFDHSMMEGGERLVALALADAADDHGRCWPSVKTLARKAKMSESTVKRATRAMVEAGELEVDDRGRRSNFYRFTCGLKLTPQDEMTLQPVGSSEPLVGSNGAVCEVTSDPQNRKEPSGTVRERARAPKEPAWKQVPDGELLTEPRRETARTVGLHPARVAREWAKFSQYVFPKPKRSVDQTWQNWCIRALDEPWSPPPDPRPVRREREPGEPTRLGDTIGQIMSDAEKTKRMLDARDREAERLDRASREDIGL